VCGKRECNLCTKNAHKQTKLDAHGSHGHQDTWHLSTWQEVHNKTSKQQTIGYDEQVEQTRIWFTQTQMTWTKHVFRRSKWENSRTPSTQMNQTLKQKDETLRPKGYDGVVNLQPLRQLALRYHMIRPKFLRRAWPWRCWPDLVSSSVGFGWCVGLLG